MRADRNWTTATVVAIRDVAEGIREITLRPEQGAGSYPAGSHLGVRVLIEERTELRYYSLIGMGPVDGTWKIAVKREEPGRGGSRYMWSHSVGARLEVAEPDTHFPLSLDAPDYLLIAGGIGITPLIGMAEILMRRGASLRLVYAGRSRRQMAYLDDLEKLLGPRLQVFAGDEGSRLDLAREIAALHPSAEAYLCGPISLLETARAVWQASGRRRDGLAYETFGSSGRHASEAFKVHVPSHDLEVTVDAGTSMLDALEAAGVPLLADCRRGECGLCAIDVVACDGQIDHRDVFFSEHQHAQGNKTCACVSRVTGGSISVEPPFRPDRPLRSGKELASAK